MKLIKLLVLFVISFSLMANDCNLQSPLRSFRPTYAKKFRIDYFKKFKIVHVGTNSSTIEYLLANDLKIDCDYKGLKLKTPVTKVVMMSTTYLPALLIIHAVNSLVGFQGKHYIVSPAFNLEKIKEVAFKFNPEELLNLKSDLIMGYESNLSNLKQLEVLHSLNVPVVLNKDFEETNPLARAEWIIYISAFYNKENEAMRFFNEIDERYTKLKNENAKIKSLASVLVGEIQGGQWVTSGGTSDLAQLIKDAGGNLLLSQNSSSTQNIALETLTQIKVPIDIWLTHNSWLNREQLIKVQKKDSRYLLISPKNIYNNNLILNKNMSNDYWEMGMQRPDLLLLDLSAIFHPEEFKQHRLHWYQKL